MGAFRRLTASALLFAPVALFCGCRGNSDLVEAELRTRDFQLHTLRDQLGRLESYNDALQREVKSLRDGSAWLSPEVAAQTFPLRNIVLGRPTGGLDEDGQPGDEALQVLVEPRDAEGHLLKVPGTLLVVAQEILPEGMKKPLSTWEVSGEELRRSWRAGLITTGYSLVLPWKAWPCADKVRVIARLILTDGRASEAEKDVTVRVAPDAQRKVVPPAAPFVPPAPRPAPGPEVPPPIPPVPGAQPAAHWQKTKRVPLSDGVQLGRPVALPLRVEWSR